MVALLAVALASTAVFQLSSDPVEPPPDEPAPPEASPLLSWSPPLLFDPVTVYVDAFNNRLELDDATDYVVVMPDYALRVQGGLSIKGGHNVVLIGGEIDIPWQGPGAASWSRRALLLEGQTGTVHVEGLLLRGTDIAEGVNLDQRKGAAVQLQNIRVENVHHRGSPDDTHADVVQTWAGPTVLRIDKLSGSTNYQGLFLAPNQFWSGTPDLFDLRRIDITGATESAYLLWQSEPGFPLEVDSVWVNPSPERVNDRTMFLWPKGDEVWDDVHIGTPPTGPFVPPGVAGIDYVTPGYA